MVKENKKSKKKGFTLVELLAVIVILAIILVIAVPKVMSVIEDSKKATLESTAKMIASAAEKAKVQNTVLGNTEEITCDSVTKLNDVDYANCSIEFDNNTAKVTIEGSGKFDGLYVCNGTKTSAEASKEECKEPTGADIIATLPQTFETQLPISSNLLYFSLVNFSLFSNSCLFNFSISKPPDIYLLKYELYFISSFSVVDSSCPGYMIVSFGYFFIFSILSNISVKFPPSKSHLPISPLNIKSPTNIIFSFGK